MQKDCRKAQETRIGAGLTRVSRTNKKTGRQTCLQHDFLGRGKGLEEVRDTQKGIWLGNVVVLEGPPATTEKHGQGWC